MYTQIFLSTLQFTLFRAEFDSGHNAHILTLSRLLVLFYREEKDQSRLVREFLTYMSLGRTLHNYISIDISVSEVVTVQTTAGIGGLLQPFLCIPSLSNPSTMYLNPVSFSRPTSCRPSPHAGGISISSELQDTAGRGQW